MGKYDGLIRYDKLIRNKVDGIIEASGCKVKKHIADDREYWSALRLKLAEELGEFLEKPSLEELADMIDVIYAIADFKFGGVRKLENVRKAKVEKRGGFEKRLILDETDNR